MLTEDGKHLYVSHEEYHSLIERLAVRIHDSGWHFDMVLCLARGGLRPGDILSRIFDKPLAILAVRSYRGMAGTVQGVLQIGQHVTHPEPELAGSILLVDDLVDSGKTLQQVQCFLQEHHPAVTAMRTAVLWSKAASVFHPDYVGEHLPSDPWIHQPFEIYDGNGVGKLADKWRRMDGVLVHASNTAMLS